MSEEERKNLILDVHVAHEEVVAATLDQDRARRRLERANLEYNRAVEAVTAELTRGMPHDPR